MSKKIKVAIENNPTRDIALFANVYQKEYNADVILFDMIDIYNILLIEKPNIIILQNITNIYIEQLIKDANLGLKIDTKFVVLNKKTSNNNISNLDIKYIEPNTYRLYDEYMTYKQSENFIFGVLNCDDTSVNDKLSNILYPNSCSMPIRLVNCPRYNSVHNLGTATEEEIMDLISRCNIYINTNDIYLYDAIFMNKKIINLVNNNNSITQKTVDEAQPVEMNDLSQYKISNIIKHIIKP